MNCSKIVSTPVEPPIFGHNQRFLQLQVRITYQDLLFLNTLPACTVMSWI